MKQQERHERHAATVAVSWSLSSETEAGVEDAIGRILEQLSGLSVGLEGITVKRADPVILEGPQPSRVGTVAAGVARNKPEVPLRNGLVQLQPSEAGGEKKKRGRPPKSRETEASNGAANDTQGEASNVQATIPGS